MGLKVETEDRIEAVGYTTGYSAQGVLRYLTSEYDSGGFSSLEEDLRDVRVYENKRYRVKVIIEEA